MIRIGYYPGSFDPLTNGHLDIIERAMRLCDKLTIGVGAHHGKKPMLALNTRMNLIGELVKPLAEESNCECAVDSFDGLVVDAARHVGADMIVRGVRDGSDFDYEMRMSQMNAALASDVNTVFLAASSGVGFISSTLVRQIAIMGGDITTFVPDACALELAAALAD